METQKRGKKLLVANNSEILRANQKDDEFIKRLRDRFLKLLEKSKGKDKLLAISFSEIPLKLLYLVFTSGLNNQTLGEEYTGIIQINLKKITIPSLFARLLGGVLEIIGERGLIKILEKLKKYINNDERKRNNLQPKAVLLFNSIIDKLKFGLPIIILLHKSLFYIYGRYYSFSRRLTGIDYAKIYGRRSNYDGVSWGLKLLGVITLAQCLLQIYQILSTQIETIDNVKFDKKNEQGNLNNCQLCMETSESATSLTPCGHLFCWNCLSDWVQLKPQCPFCRDQFIPSRIVHLKNL